MGFQKSMPMIRLFRRSKEMERSLLGAMKNPVVVHGLQVGGVSLILPIFQMFLLMNSSVVNSAAMKGLSTAR